MRFSIVSTALAAIWTVAPTPAPAAVLQPIESWNLDYGATQCTAARSFGNPASPLTIGIIPSLSGGTYKVLVSVPRSGPAFARGSLGAVDFGRGEIPAPVLNYGRSGVPMSVYQFRVPATAMEQARSAPSVTLRSNTGAGFAFALSDMPALLDGLRACTASLQGYWNMAGLPAGSTAASPRMDLGTLLTAANYPTEAYWKQQQGAAQYQLLVDEKGAVAGCDVLVPSGVPSVDATGCEVIEERARFSAARDSSGRPVRSVWTTAPLAWNVEGQHSLDTGCIKESSDTRTLLMTCQQQVRPPVFPPEQVSTLPPPPPPPKK